MNKFSRRIALSLSFSFTISFSLLRVVTRSHEISYIVEAIHYLERSIYIGTYRNARRLFYPMSATAATTVLLLCRRLVAPQILSDFCKTPARKAYNLFSTMADKSAVCLLAEGAEEMEAIVTVDILRRAGVSL